MSEIRVTDTQAANVRIAVDVVTQNSVAGEDFVTIEEPLEIRVVFGPGENRTEQSLSVTMRTPGDDFELTLGFLMGEAIITSPNDVESIATCGPPSPDKGLLNVIKIELSPATQFDAERLTRYTYTTSSCGVCGKASLDAVRVTIPAHSASAFSVSADALKRLPARLSAQQTEFARTGGLHASAIFDADGTIERTREDVGRHNALDKLIGSYFQEGQDSLQRRGLILSGRLSFELVQKAALAGIPLIAAIGPPSSLAIELAEESGITLVGFLRSDRFNVYCGSRVVAG